jgi:hypothetical protein
MDEDQILGRLKDEQLNDLAAKAYAAMVVDDYKVELYEQVRMLRVGAQREQERMTNPDGTPTVYSVEHGHFADAYESVLRLIAGSNDGPS